MRIISTITEIDLDLTPQDTAYQLKRSDYLCFLDSSLIPNKYSRFSYIGWEPSFVIKSWGLKNEFINLAKKITNFSYQHPLKYFKENLSSSIFHLPEDKEANIRIPDDISIIGFDDLEFSAFLNPPLTTVEQPKRAFGEKIFQTLLGLIRGESNQSIVVFPKLIIRGTTKELNIEY